jgi:hypothetical protein
MIYRRLGLTIATWLAAMAAGHALAGVPGLTFALGLVTMDLAWALKAGIPQAIWYQWRHRNDPPPAVAEGDWEQFNDFDDQDRH